MKQLLVLIAMSFGLSVFAAEPAKTPAKQETNCVTKDKKGNCPAAPKSPKPTPKKKAETPK
jgi:hypothetical protein